MLKHRFILLFLLASSAPLSATDYYFNRVNVIPMDSEQVLTEQRVVVRNGRISAIGPAASIAVPDAAVRIEAKGKYLLPGLAEMHAHVPSKNQGEQTARDVLMLYLANGITTIRGMLGEPWHLELRTELETGRWTGPRLITSGPSFNGRSVSSPRQAEDMVRQQVAAGYDFLKLHPGLERDEYRAIVDAADSAGIPLAGHVSNAVGLPLTLISHQASIDHLDGYAQELVSPLHDLYGTPPAFFGINLSAGLSSRNIGALAGATRDNRVWNVPTQSLLENILYAQTIDALMARPEMVYMKPLTRNTWRKRVLAMRVDISPELAEKYLGVRRELIRQLQARGAGLLLGSDAPQMMNVPGFSIHEELAYMVNAGLSPYQALAMGTVNVAAFFEEEDRGRVAVRQQADLVLLEANPLEDIANTRKVAGVMHAGQWYNRKEIDRALNAIRERGI
jgi:imidazolonepropionase-like amidohydrolase